MDTELDGSSTNSPANDDDELQGLLKYDTCHKLADKYLIAMVFMYFLRAAFRPEEYTRLNFLAALYLAHDMEEEDDENQMDLLLFAGPDDSPWSSRAVYDIRLYLFKRMGYRAVVSRACCESVMRATNPQHPVWRRDRYEVHSGASRSHDRSREVCPNCISDFLDENE